MYGHTIGLLMLLCALVAGIMGGLLPPQDGGVIGQSDRTLIMQMMERLAALETREVELETKVKELETQNTRLAKDVARLEQQTREQKGHMDALNAANYTHGLSTRTTGPSRAIAFTAWAKQDQHYLGVNQNLQFEHVVNNVGGAYDSHSGIFTVPVTGIYVFSVTTLAYQGVQSYYRVAVNGQTDDTKAWIFVSNAPKGEQGSVTFNLILMAGDIVAVKNLGADGAVTGGGFTSFSGFLLLTTV